VSTPAGGRWWQRTEFWLLLANLLVYAVVLLLDPQHNFGSATSLQLLLTETTMLGIFAIGTTIVILSGGIDLSVGTVIAFSSIIFTVVIKKLVPAAELSRAGVGPAVLVLATLATLLVSLLIGLLHAALITGLNLPPFIATLGTLIGLRSLARVLSQSLFQSDKIAVSAKQFRALYNATWPVQVPLVKDPVLVRWVPLLVFALVAVAGMVVMRRTVLGRHLYALGGNEQAARLSGIRTNRLKFVAYMIGSFCGGLAGILYAAREGQGNAANLGVGYELNAIAAAVVGGASLRGGAGTLTGTILGALFLTLVVNGIPNLIKIDSSLYEGLIVGLVVVLAVAVNQLRTRGTR
jgi:ribose/xylose/arabinose/galactoside ABC-type transport system permease subunit